MKDLAPIPTRVVAAEVEAVAAHHRSLPHRASPWTITTPDPTHRRQIVPVPERHRIAAGQIRPALIDPDRGPDIPVNRVPLLAHSRRPVRSGPVQVRRHVRVPVRKALPVLSDPEGPVPGLRRRPAVQSPGLAAALQQIGHEAVPRSIGLAVEAQLGLGVDPARDRVRRQNLNRAVDPVPGRVNPDPARRHKPSPSDPSPRDRVLRRKAAEAVPVRPTRKWEKNAREP